MKEAPMKTIRDHIAGTARWPAPPPGATHALVWESYGDSGAQWVLADLDADPDDGAVFLAGSADRPAGELARVVPVLLGYPVELSARIEVDGEVVYYVTPAGGGR